MPLDLGGLGRPQQSTSTLGGGGITSLNLQKGMSLDLSKHSNLKHVRLGLGWQAGNGVNFDLDASALLLNSRGRVNDSQDVIFYNQLDTNRGVKSLGDNRTGSYQNVGEDDDETILVDLNAVPQTTDSILFIVTIDQARMRNQNFGMVKNAYIRVVDDDTNQELARYKLNEDFSLQISCEIAKLKRSSFGWEFVAIGNGRTDDLGGVLISYGVS
jgi:tellurium resistance protein TerD